LDDGEIHGAPSCEIAAAQISAPTVRALMRKQMSAKSQQGNCIEPYMTNPKPIDYDGSS